MHLFHQKSKPSYFPLENTLSEPTNLHPQNFHLPLLPFKPREDVGDSLLWNSRTCGLIFFSHLVPFFGLWWSFLLKAIVSLSLILSYNPQHSTEIFTLPKPHLIHCCPSFWSVEKFLPPSPICESLFFIRIKRILSFFPYCGPSLLKKEPLLASYPSFNGAWILYDMFVAFFKNLFFLCFNHAFLSWRKLFTW